MTDQPCGPSGHGHDCRQVVLDLLGEYEAGTLSESDRASLEEHIRACPPCVSFLATYRATGKCLKALKPSEVPGAMVNSILDFVRVRRKRKK